MTDSFVLDPVDCVALFTIAFTLNQHKAFLLPFPFLHDRALVLFLVFVLTFSFWLFYGVRIIQDRYHDYHKIVSFAVSLVDALLFVHYLAVILLEIRHLSPKYIVKVSRSPDGETRTITMGELRYGHGQLRICKNVLTM